eukprot:COSAG01_NODE_19494_length_1006_cov_3.965821_3_plen_82_part_01
MKFLGNRFLLRAGRSVGWLLCERRAASFREQNALRARRGALYSAAAGGVLRYLTKRPRGRDRNSMHPRGAGAAAVIAGAASG